MDPRTWGTVERNEIQLETCMLRPRALHRESAPAPGVRDQYDLAGLLTAAGTAWLQQGDIRQAERLFREGMQIWRKIGIRDGPALGLAGLGNVPAARGQSKRAGRLLSAATAPRDRQSTTLNPRTRRLS